MKELNLHPLTMEYAQYLQEENEAEYVKMIALDQYEEHLNEMDLSIREQYQTLVEQLKRSRQITEKLKETDPILWAQEINNIRMTAKEIIRSELFS